MSLGSACLAAASAFLPPSVEPERSAAVGAQLERADEPSEDVEPEDPAVHPDPSEPERTFSAGVFVDTAYVFNSNLPSNHLYRGAFTTPRTGELTVNLAVAHFEHLAVPKEPWRLQLALQAGAAADAVWGDEPVPGGDDGRLAGSEVWKHIGLANAGFVVPRLDTRISGGIMAAPFGIGGLWSKDNWNYSPSWLANGSPYYLAGVAVEQPLGAGFGLYGWAINGWQTVGDANRAPSYLGGLTWAQGDVAAATAVFFGPETADLSPRAWRMLSDTTVTWNTDRIGIAGIVDVGRERVTTLPSEPLAQWIGGALFMRGRVLDREKLALELSARPEVFWDRDGRMYGVPQTLISATGTLGAEIFSHLLARLEYRYDHSTADDGFFFVGDRTSPDALDLAGDQHTVFLSLVGYFARAFAVAPRLHRAP